MASKRDIKLYVPLEIKVAALCDESIFYNPLDRKWYRETECAEEEYTNHYIDFKPIPEIVKDTTKFNPKKIKLKLDSNEWYFNSVFGDVELPEQYKSSVINYLIDSVEKEVINYNTSDGKRHMHNPERAHKIAVSIVRCMLEQKIKPESRKYKKQTTHPKKK
jgi:hypothetical protein